MVNLWIVIDRTTYTLLKLPFEDPQIDNREQQKIFYKNVKKTQNMDTVRILYVFNVGKFVCFDKSFFSWQYYFTIKYILLGNIWKYSYDDDVAVACKQIP